VKQKPIKHHFWEDWTPEQIEAFNENPPGFAEVLGSIENLMMEILVAAGLPIVWHGPYAPVDLVLRRQLEEIGVDWESREGYAARCLYQCWLVRTAGANPEIIAIHAMHLGSLTTEGVMHKHWERGLLVSMGGKKGAAIIKEKRACDDAEIRQFFNEERAKGVSKQDAYKAVARRVPGVTPRTVRHVITGH
jgi:hypothetical protein